jgi:hypothetical protein
MKFMIALLMAVLPALSFAQSELLDDRSGLCRPRYGCS